MRKCPLNNFEECIGDECPLYNIRLGACVLPRLVLTIIKSNEKTLESKELKEQNYDRTEKSR